MIRVQPKPPNGQRQPAPSVRIPSRTACSFCGKVRAAAKRVITAIAGRNG